MKKLILLAVIITIVIFEMSTPVVLGSGGFSVTPTKLKTTVDGDTVSSLYVYITSHFDGELIIGKEDIPFRIEPASITVNSTDANRKVELLVYGNNTLEQGDHSGKLTFLACTGQNIGYGVKVETTITQLNRDTSENGDTESTPESKSIIERYWWTVIVAVVVVAVLITAVFVGRKIRKSS